MTKNTIALPPLESVKEDRIIGDKLELKPLNSEWLYASKAIFGVPLEEAADLYIPNATISMASHFPRFYFFNEQLLQKPYDLLDESK